MGGGGIAKKTEWGKVRKQVLERSRGRAQNEKSTKDGPGMQKWRKVRSQGGVEDSGVTEGQEGGNRKEKHFWEKTCERHPLSGSLFKSHD